MQARVRHRLAQVGHYCTSEHDVVVRRVLVLIRVKRVEALTEQLGEGIGAVELDLLDVALLVGNQDGQALLLLCGLLGCGVNLVTSLVER